VRCGAKQLPTQMFLGSVRRRTIVRVSLFNVAPGKKWTGYKIMVIVDG
jgi:hypothetical protein